MKSQGWLWIAALAFVPACARDAPTTPDAPAPQEAVAAPVAAAAPDWAGSEKVGFLVIALNDAKERLLPALADQALGQDLAVSLGNLTASLEQARAPEATRALREVVDLLGKADGDGPDAADLAAIHLVVGQARRLLLGEEGTAQRPQ